MLTNNIKIMHISDIHLESEFSLNNIIGENFSKRREEIWETFERAFIYARDNDIEVVLISGDIYENDFISISSLERLAFIFNKYKEIKVFISLGNHDHISIKSEYLKSIVSENVYIFSDALEYKEYKNIRIYGFSWAKMNYQTLPFDFPVLDKEFLNILLLHGTISSDTKYLPIDVNKLEEINFDYIALGHIHKYSKVANNTYYSGSIEPLSFGDLGPHGAIILNIKNKEYDIKFLPLASRNYHIIDINISKIYNNRDMYEFILDKLKTISKEDIIRIILKGNKRKILDFSELELILNSNYELIEIVDETRPYYNIEDIINANKDNIIGKYFEHIQNNYNGKELNELVNIGLEIFPLEEIYEN